MGGRGAMSATGGIGLDGMKDVNPTLFEAAFRGGLLLYATVTQR
jgi:hypothetical protein